MINNSKEFPVFGRDAEVVLIAICGAGYGGADVSGFCAQLYDTAIPYQHEVLVADGCKALGMIDDGERGEPRCVPVTPCCLSRSWEQDEGYYEHKHWRKVAPCGRFRGAILSTGQLHAYYIYGMLLHYYQTREFVMEYQSFATPSRPAPASIFEENA